MKNTLADITPRMRENCHIQDASNTFRETFRIIIKTTVTHFFRMIVKQFSDDFGTIIFQAILRWIQNNLIRFQMIRENFQMNFRLC